MFLVGSRRHGVVKPTESRHAHVGGFHVAHGLDEATDGNLQRVSLAGGWLLDFKVVRQKLGHRLLGMAMDRLGEVEARKQWTENGSPGGVLLGFHEARQHLHGASAGLGSACPSPKPHPPQLTTADALATGQGR